MKYLLAWLCLTASLYAETPVKLSMDKKGVEIDSGRFGKFVILTPLYMLTGDNSLKPEFKTSGDKGEAVYSNGASFSFELKEDEIICSYRGMPADGTGSFKFFMEIPLTFNEGGKYLLGSKDPQAFREFPKEIQTEQFFEIGSDSEFTFVNKPGNGLTLEMKTNWYGLQDNRIYKTNNYSYQFLVDPKAVTGNSFVIKVKPFKLP